MVKKIAAKVINFLLMISVYLSALIPLSVRATAPEPQASVPVEQAVLDEINSNGTTSYWVNFRAQPDLSRATGMNWSERGTFVLNQLSQTATNAQESVLKFLDKQGVSYQSFWVKNTVLVEGSDSSVLYALLNFAEVESIEARREYALIEPEEISPAPENSNRAIESNLTHINADDVWALGYMGEGMVVANIDSGVRFSHEALVNQYRGKTADGFNHNYNWFDPLGLRDTPYDPHPVGHGTHTMGTMVGDDGGTNQIGIAPGAQWIACSVYSSFGMPDSGLLACGQWMLAPTDTAGNNPNPNLRPNIVNNSWGNCDQFYDPWFFDVIKAWHDAGIYPVFSNGNASNCGYSRPPGLNTVGNPARYGNVTGVGSTGTSDGVLATHSNWGPTDNPDTINPVSGFANMKPQVLAPGVAIRSSVASDDFAYALMTGTSMSAPHVSGLVALMWQAAPCLVGDYATTETLIEQTAVDIIYDDGSELTPTDFPNFATGWGEIDALAAVLAAIDFCPSGLLQGRVTDSDTLKGLPGVEVMISGMNVENNRTVYTDKNGDYSAKVNPDTYTMVFSKYGYHTGSISDVVVEEDQIVTRNVNLSEMDKATISGVVRDGGLDGGESHGYPLYAGLTFSFADFSQKIYNDPFSGEFEIILYQGYKYFVSVSAVSPGYHTHIDTITVGAINPYQVIELTVMDDVCCAPGYESKNLYQNFNLEELPPGWHVIDYAGTGEVWRFDNPGDRANGTPSHDGGFAIVDSTFYDYNQDTGLQTPVLDLSEAPLVVLNFETDFFPGSHVTASVRISNDNGNSWITKWTQTDRFTGLVSLDLTADAAGYAQVIIEFLYVSDSLFYWQVDNVEILTGQCYLVPGGIVAGYVFDENFGTVLIPATVDNSETVIQTFELEDDPEHAGLYWIFTQAKSNPENIYFTASSMFFESCSEFVSVYMDEVNHHDFTLAAGQLSFSPPEIEVTMNMGDGPQVSTFTLNNGGHDQADFELLEKNMNFLPAISTRSSFPDLPFETLNSLEEESEAQEEMIESTSRASDLIASDAAYAIDVTSPALVHWSNIHMPELWEVVGATKGDLFSADFIGSDFSKLYAISSSSNILYTLDTATGAYTEIGMAIPPEGSIWTGLTGMPDGRLLGLTSDPYDFTCLVSVDPDTADVITLRSFRFIEYGVDLAYHTGEAMLYIIDADERSLFRVDPMNYWITNVGPLDWFDFNQGLDYEEESSTLYWARSSYGVISELRIIDTATAATTLVGAFPEGSQIDSLAFATSAPVDVPWLSETPNNGTVSADGSTTITLTFDPSTLTQPGDYTAELKVRNNTPYTYNTIPITLHLEGAVDYGRLVGTVAGLEACDVKPQVLPGATVKVWQEDQLITSLKSGAKGDYDVNLPVGSYHLEVFAPGYVKQITEAFTLEKDQVITSNFDLRLNTPCLSVEPTSMEQTLVKGTSATQSLILSNSGAASAAFEIEEEVMAPQALILSEGFEGGLIPPSGGWEVVHKGETPNQWMIADVMFDPLYVYHGNYAAMVKADTLDSDEWLISPVIDTASLGDLSLQFWAISSVKNELATMKLWITDPTGEMLTADPLWDMLRDEFWEEFEYRLVTVDLSKFDGHGPIRMAWEYVGVEGQNFGLDAIELSGKMNIPWLSEEPELGWLAADIGKQEILITMNAHGLLPGDYSARLAILQDLQLPISIPILLHVTDLYQLFLPILSK